MRQTEAFCTVSGNFKPHNIYILTFDKKAYLGEMQEMIDRAITRLKNEQKDFKVFTISLWTDPDAAASSFNIDSKENSDKKVEKSNEWNRRYYDQFVSEGDLEQAKLFEPTAIRNCNPADFALRDFEEINHSAIPPDWEMETEGECWNDLEPALKEIGEKCFEMCKDLNLEGDFELSVNGRNDWYEFTWTKK
jgi:hypothetical protein